MIDKKNIIRFFSYCDAQGINSIYSQLFPNAQEITITDKKSSGFTGTAGLPYILQGFIGTNITGEISRDWDTEKSSKVTISIEDKVRSILQNIKHDGLIDEWHDKPSLVAGYATIIDYETFVKRVENIFAIDSIKYTDYVSFFEDNRYDSQFEDIWKMFIEYACKCNIFHNYGSYFKLQRDIGRKGIIMKSIAVDLRYPVILNYSAEKLLLSNSHLENANLLAELPSTGILGILGKVGPGLYTLKPLAMWHDLSYTSYSDFIDRAAEEKEHRYLEKLHKKLT